MYILGCIYVFYSALREGKLFHFVITSCLQHFWESDITCTMVLSPFYQFNSIHKLNLSFMKRLAYIASKDQNQDQDPGVSTQTQLLPSVQKPSQNSSESSLRALRIGQVLCQSTLHSIP